MSEVSPADIERMIADNVDLAEGFRFEVLDLADGARVKLHYNDRMLRLGGTISGPVLMMLVDTAMYAAVIAHAEHGQYGVTSHLNIEFLRRPPPAALIAEARLLRVGRRQVTGTVVIHSEGESRPVLHATGGYAVFPPVRGA